MLCLFHYRTTPLSPPNALPSFQARAMKVETDTPAAVPIPKDIRNSKILIVDDEIVNIKVVEKYLRRDGYSRFVTTTDSLSALDIIREVSPDLVLLDVMMPGVDGLGILEEMRRDPQLKYLPTLILTAVSDPQAKQRALQLGATDFLPKPVDPADLHPRVRNALIGKAHQDELQRYAERLEQEVRVRTAELEASRQDIIFCLAGAGEYRDRETGNHVIRVGLYAGIVGRELGFDDDTANLLEQAALLHDVGKIGVSDLILLKPGQLSADEFALMQKHCEIGRNIIEPSTDIRWRNVGGRNTSNQCIPIGKSPIMSMASRIALSHHEQWDGQGYPRGLSGEDIPIEGRIVAVVDVFDALSSARPYKQAIPLERCFEIMQDGRGTHFDPAVFDAFLRVKDQILCVQAEYIDHVSSPETCDTRTQAECCDQCSVTADGHDAAAPNTDCCVDSSSVPVDELRRAFASGRRSR